ncbi:MAG: hypothetical protein R3360_04825 [Alphaproteobacteria bacterium]|nr:hypothetical protein [Alphaproteobacteria bacterium]
MNTIGYLISAVLIGIGAFVIYAMFQEQETRREKWGFIKGMGVGLLGLALLFYIAVALILGDWVEPLQRLGWITR